MNGWGGLIELVLVFAFVLGWGVLELRGVRLDKRKADAAAKKAAADGSSAASARRSADDHRTVRHSGD